MKYVEEFNVYLDDDLVIYADWKSTRPPHSCVLYQPKIYTNKKGYKIVKVKLKSGKWMTISVHRIIATAFVPNPDHKPTVDHINRNPSDNRVANLRWATSKEQMWNRECVINSKYGHIPGGLDIETHRAYLRTYMQNYRKMHKDLKFVYTNHTLPEPQNPAIFPPSKDNEMSINIKTTNTQDRTRLNIRKTLDDYTYTDKRTDLPHKLTTDEKDSLARFFYQSDDIDWDERDIISIAERQIRKRLGLK